jgi:flagellar hook assembly protein FlgD
MPKIYNLVIQQYVYYTVILGQTNGTTVYYWVSAEDVEGNISTTNKQSYLIGTLATDSDVTPNDFGLHGNYPNPFNPVTNIIYSMDTASDVIITVHNIKGQLVKNLFIGNVQPGRHNVSWNGTDHFAQSVPSGIYIYSVKSSRRILAGKMMLLK